MGFKCVIPAAGFGIRLKDIVSGGPKALLPLGDRTILDNLLERLNELEKLDEICIITNEVFYASFKDYLKKYSAKNKINLISNKVSKKEKARGAIKDTLFAIEKMGWQKSDVLIFGSDNFIMGSLTEASSKFIEKDNSMAVACDYGDKNMAGKLVVPEINEKGRITHIEEKPKEPRTTLGCPLIYFIKSGDLKYLKKLAEEDKDNIGHLLELILRDSSLDGFIFKDKVIDIGTPSDYSLAQELFNKQLHR